MAGCKGVKEGRLGVCRAEDGHVVRVAVKLGEDVRRAHDAAYAENVEAFLGERAGLIEADDVDLAADVDARR